MQAPARVEPPRILDEFGKPFEQPHPGKISANGSRTIRRSFATYLSALFRLDIDPIYRATEPFANHPWVYAAAMARAVNISQAPFIVFREVPEETESRRAQAKRAGRPWLGPKAGARRRAVLRHLTRSANPGRYLGMPSKRLEPDLDHPLMDVFTRPSPMFSGTQLWQSTELWMALRGEAIWLLLGKEGQRRAPGAAVEEIWPISPDVLTPVKRRGRLVAWQYRIMGVGSGPSTLVSTVGAPASPLAGQGGGFMVTLGLHEVVQFKYVGLGDPWRGFPPLTSVAATVNLDMLAKDHNRSVLMHGADPGGVFVDEGGEQWDEAEQEAFIEKFEQRHKGTSHRKELAILPTGIKYIPVGLSPQDMEYLDSLRHGREEIFAVERTPKTIVGVTDTLNYATQIGQDRNFTDKTLIPEWRMFEDVLDATLFFAETDDVVGAFDLSNVEALRLGIDQKIKTAAKMSGQELHAPPRVSLALVGLQDVPEYEADDVALVKPLLAPAGLIASGGGILALPGGSTQGGQGGEGSGDGDGKTLAVLGHAPVGRDQDTKARYWNALRVQVLEPTQRLYVPAWRAWVNRERREQLQRFDEATRRLGIEPTGRVNKLEPLNIDVILTALVDMQNRLKLATRPIYFEELQSTYEFTVEFDLGGIPVFALDDPRLLQFFEEHVRRIVGIAPVTLQRNLRKSLLAGIQAGETVQELRQRVAQVFDISASSAKALMVARTEAGAFMNGVRDTMFKVQGFESFEWTTAGDELVREHHRVFGAAGPQSRDFNWLSLVGGAGILTRPHDPQGPAGEVVNCRCAIIPV